jgi:thymidylate synthase
LRISIGGLNGRFYCSIINSNCISLWSLFGISTSKGDDDSMNEQYYQILKDIIDDGIMVNPRGFTTQELLGYKFTLQNPKERIITYPTVMTNLLYAEEELKWYMKGAGKIDFSPKIEKVWKQFSDDGIRVNSNYGERFFGRHPILNINQWNWVKDELTKDPNSRRAIMNINSWFDKKNPTKDFPCCIALHFFIRNNSIYANCMFRSSDAFLGLRNDIFTLTALQERMAIEMNMRLGSFNMFCSSLHLYEKDFKKAQAVLDGDMLSNEEYNIDWAKILGD